MILLDTHALVWMDADDPRFGPNARSVSDAALQAVELAVSAISYWEVGMLTKKRRLRIQPRLEHWRQDQIRSGLVEIPVDGAIGIAAAELDEFHGDPADRIIVATAVQHGAQLLTSDKRILAWRGPLSRTDVGA